MAEYRPPTDQSDCLYCCSHTINNIITTRMDNFYTEKIDNFLRNSLLQLFLELTLNLFINLVDPITIQKL